MSAFYLLQQLLTEKAEVQAKIRTIPFDGSIEVKTIKDERYIYVRKREAGKYTSTYIDKYSEELYALAVTGSMQVRELRRRLRKIEKQLAELGYSEGDLSPRVKMNIDFARANVKSLIYDQAVLEGITTTFPQTETIIENGEVNGVKASDIQKILNLKRSWELITDPDVVSSACDYYLLCHIAKLVNEGFFRDGGAIRGVPVSIGGSSYIPPMPNDLDVRECIRDIVNSPAEPIDIAVELMLYCMKTQIFIDGNKRASVIFANHYMIRNGLGLLVIPENLVTEFKSLLVEYYEDRNCENIKTFLKEKCRKTF
ncbi:MAG: Fic family protein [Clostridia bacterium]|nr:Fic family protein [Clostridia bacterium]